jgi:hypothetical protein
LLVHTEEVTGSIPVSPTTRIRVLAQVRGSLYRSHRTSRMGPVARLGGIWEVIFSLPPRAGSSWTVAPGAAGSGDSSSTSCCRSPCGVRPVRMGSQQASGVSGEMTCDSAAARPRETAARLCWRPGGDRDAGQVAASEMTTRAGRRFVTMCRGPSLSATRCRTATRRTATGCSKSSCARTAGMVIRPRGKPHVGLDGCDGRGVGEERFRLRDDDGVVVDIDDAGSGVRGAGDLVDVAAGGQPRAGVEELGDAALAGEAADGARQERSVVSCGPRRRGSRRTAQARLPGRWRSCPCRPAGNSRIG